MKKRLVVGLTGSFGSGKTTVTKILKKLGAKKILSADKLAHEALEPGNECLKKIRALFYLRGPVSRRRIAGEVFSSPKKRKALEAIIHPYVRQRMMKEVGKVKRGIIILEVPLLFEAKFDKICDITITVTAGRLNIMKRLTRTGYSRSEISSRLLAQFSEERKMRKADFIIQNKGSKKLLEKKTKFVWHQLLLRLNQNEN